MIMSMLGVAAVFAEWAITAVCAALAVAWVVKELLMGVCKIEKRIDGKDTPQNNSGKIKEVLIAKPELSNRALCWAKNFSKPI